MGSYLNRGGGGIGGGGLGEGEGGGGGVWERELGDGGAVGGGGAGMGVMGVDEDEVIFFFAGNYFTSECVGLYFSEDEVKIMFRLYSSSGRELVFFRCDKTIRQPHFFFFLDFAEA